MLCVLVKGVAIARERGPLPDGCGVKLFKWDGGLALYAVPFFVFGFSSHHNVVAVFHELDHQPSHLVSACFFSGHFGNLKLTPWPSGCSKIP